MSKKMKIFSTVMTVIVMFVALSTVSMATGVNPSEIAGQLGGTTTNASSQVINMGNQIIGIITTVGVVVAVIVLLVLGIKYMMGSASEKAEYKKTMIPYLIGALLIFGALAITKVVIALADGLKTT